MTDRGSPSVMKHIVSVESSSLLLLFFYICYSLHNQMKVHIIVLSSTVIFTAVSYDVFNSHYITLVFVYM